MPQALSPKPWNQHQVEAKASLERKVREVEDALRVVEGRKADEDYKGRCIALEASLSQVKA